MRYIGFDAVSTTAEEAKNPQRDLPIGIIASLVICTLLYLVVSGGARPGILPGASSDKYATSQFLNAPVGYALAVIHQDWAAGLVSAGAVAGITSVLLVMLMSQPRIFFAMSRDRLLPAGAARSTRSSRRRTSRRSSPASSCRSRPRWCRFRSSAR